MEAVFLAALLFPWLSAAQGAPSLVLFNGTIYTVNPRNEVVQAVALQGDTIAAVGTDDEILALAGEATLRIDLGGKTVVPGLIDADGPAGGGPAERIESGAGHVQLHADGVAGASPSKGPGRLAPGGE